MIDVLSYALIGVLTALVVAGLSALFRRAKPMALADTSGAIRPERWSAWITIILGVAMIVGAAAIVILNPNMSSALHAAPAALLGAAIAGFMAPSATSIHAVRWNAVGIEGPSTTFGLTLGTKRTELAWEQIARTGKTPTGYWYVEADDGRRVYWSYLYAGYGALTHTLKQRRPSLQLPPDLN